MRRCDCESRDAERCAERRGDHEECACACHYAQPRGDRPRFANDDTIAALGPHPVEVCS